MSDQELRELEHRASADPSDRALRRAFHAALFKLGRDPFPRQLWTDEWERVFETRPKRIDVATCPGHRVVEGGVAVGLRCPPAFERDAWGRELIASFETVERLERAPVVDRAETQAAKKKVMPGRVLLRFVGQLRDDRWLSVEADFYDLGLGEERLHAHVTASYGPCLESVAHERQLPLRGGRAIPVAGRPVEINGLESFGWQSFNVEVGWPGGEEGRQRAEAEARVLYERARQEIPFQALSFSPSCDHCDHCDHRESKHRHPFGTTACTLCSCAEFVRRPLPPPEAMHGAADEFGGSDFP